jgi:hypothetical protein
VLVAEHKVQEELLHRRVSLEQQAMVLHISVELPIMKVAVAVVATSVAAMEETTRVVAADRVTSHY